MRTLLLLASLLLGVVLPLLPVRAAEPRPSLGINLSGPADWNTELPFVDVFRLSRSWISQRRGEGWGRGPQLELDEHGWVRRLEPGCFAETPLMTVPAGRRPAGVYTVLYEGKGRLEFSAGRVVSSEPGRMRVDLGEGGGVFLRLLETDEADPVRNIRVIMPGFEDTYATNPFHPVFLDRWRGFAVLRFMDWMHTNNSRQTHWGQRPTLDSARWTGDGGVPVEVMVDLANRLGIDPWFCMPHLADDDYVRNFAEYVRDHLRPGLKVYVEYSNEVWNSQFRQHHYANEQGQAMGLGERPWEAGWRYYAKRSVEIFRIWEEVFGGRERLVRVLSSQAANAYIARQILQFEEAGRHADALAIAPYISMNVPARSDNPDRLTADRVAAMTVEQILDHVETVALPEAVRWIEAHRQVADEYGLTLIAYEAGQHLVGIQGGENNDEMTRLFHAANRHPRMGEIYRKYFAAWEANRGGVMALFASVSQWSKWGSWGLMEFYDETPAEQPKMAAALEQAAAWGQPVAAP
ncbi:MAG: hypothetical protein ACK4PI_00775 [Tepidisphaerales bacterium]